jgi:multiple sugar transport system substrate-binding protein
MQKKILPMVVMIASVSLILAGCGNQQTEKPTAKATSAQETKETATPTVSNPQKQDIKLTAMTWDSGEGLALEQKMMDAYMAQHPNVKIELQSVVQGYDEKLNILNASGETPDIFLMWNTPQFADSGVAEDLTPYIKKDNFDMSIYYDVVGAWAKYRDKIYGLPKDFTPRVIFYNKKVFDNANVPYPKDGWTWDEFADTVKKLSNGKKGKDAQYGFIALSSQTYQLAGYLWSNGGSEVSPDGTTASGYVDSPAVVETVKWYKKIFDMSARSLIATGEGNPGNAEFMSGKVAMMDNGSWPLADLTKDPNFHFGMVTPPVPKAGMQFKPVVHSSTLSMFAKSKNKDAAWDVIKFLGGPEVAKINSGSGYSPSAIKSVAAELKQDQGVMKPLFDVMKLPTNVPEFTKNPRFFEADAEFGKASEKIFLNNEDPQKTLSEAAKEMDKILKKK